jgi:formamidopyrimidine-DNA glycosylase
MPELPEVETVRRGLEPAMAGKSITRVALYRSGLRMPFPERMADIIEGRCVVRLSRRAKYLLIHVADGAGKEDVLILHLGMSGQMTVVRNIAGYNRRKHDHMILTMEDGAGIVFNDARRFGMVMLTDSASLAAHPAFEGMGPEPLPESFTGKVLHEKLRGKASSIKIALLDQRVVAGVGNIYASEALFEARISPLRTAGDIRPAEAGRLAQAIRAVLTRAIAAGGSSLRDFRQADGELGYFQHSFAVYGREGEPCPGCAGNGKKKAVIKKIVQGGRATYYCPACQK